ncbi:hypothetical protein Godav_001610 [Gossypium davidsonii]|uniref:BHLH domain-containing protein n=1 Tax=Gossypium davidsonii TaxID=34287 RepID=A0A7J8T3P7_GOSDV|nr:hypothetical protein [Gossypium davidsonii]
MASFLPDLEPGPEMSPEFERKKRRKTEGNPSSFHPTQGNRRIKQWRTQREQRIYSSNLIESLRRSPTATGNYARDMAYRLLAVSAKGRTRWSRAILLGRLAAGAKMRKHKRAKVGANRKLRKPVTNRQKRKMPAVERKLMALGRLVPGCRKLPLANLLEETSDYIAALEMQVRAMTAISEFLASGGAQPPAGRLVHS